LITAPLGVSELIADAIAECINDERNAFGILITTLSGFDIERIIRKVGEFRANGASIRLAVKGFGDPVRLKSVAIESGFSVPEEFDTTLRTAGYWRNHWKEVGTRVAIAQGRQENMHTLGQFRTITNVQVAIQLLKWAKTHVAVNMQHTNLLEALESETDFVSLRNPQLLAGYLASLIELDPVSRLSATFQRLWHLGLLPDPHLFGGSVSTDTNNTIAARLRKNMTMVRHIRDAGQTFRAEIEKTLKRLPVQERSYIERIVVRIDAYQRSFDDTLLADLTLDQVEDALQPQRVLERIKRTHVSATANPALATPASSASPGISISISDVDGNDESVDYQGQTDSDQRSSGTSRSNASKFNREKLDRYFAESVLKGEDDVCDEITNALNEAIEQYSPKIDKGTVQVEFGGQEIEEKVDEKLLNFVRKFCSETSYGGQFRTKAGSLRAAIDLIDTAEEVQFYNPYTTTSTESDTPFAELLTRYDSLFPDLYFKEALNGFVERRRKLLPLIGILTVDPFIAISPTYLDLCKEYLQSVSHLAELIKSNYNEMRERSELGARYCLAQLLSLDTVLVRCGDRGKENNKAILMPLHPMHLWSFVELAKIARSIRSEPNQYIDEDKKAFLIEMTKERHFLNTLYVSDYVTGGEQITLPLSGGIGGLPCYENTSNHYSGIDGLEELFDVVEHYCSQYRLFVNPLRVAIVDVPNVDETLALASRLLSTHKDLDSLQLDLHFTTQGASRNYLSTMLSPENEQIYQELIANGRLHMLIKLEQRSLNDIAAQFEKAPVHVMALFDQSHVRTRGFSQLVLFNSSPLCITREFNYDELLDEMRANPVTNAGIFSAYNFFVNRLKNELANRNAGVVADAQGIKNAIELVLQKEYTQWLYVADRVLPSETNLKADRLLARPVNRRQTITLAASFDHFAWPLTVLLRRYNLYPRPETVVGLMRDFANLISEGLLMLIKRSDGSFIEARQKGLLGLLLAARDYHKANPDGLIVSVDDPTSKLWLRISSTEQRADLLGVRLDEEDNFVIDVIEVKTREGSEDQQSLYEEEQGIAKGKPIAQINSTIEALGKVFKSPASGNAEQPLVPPRREVLRELFYQECQSSRHSRDFRRRWVPLLNDMFTAENADRVRIEGCIYEVALRQDFDVKQKLIKSSPTETLIHRTLGSMRVQSLLDMPMASGGAPERASKEVQMAVSSVAPIRRHAATGPSPVGTNTATLFGQENQSERTELSKREAEQPTSGKDTSGTVVTASKPTSSSRNQTQVAAVEFSWLVHVAKTFRQSCSNFGINVVDCDPNRANVGPTIVRFPFRIAQGQSKRKLDQCLEDIGREMSITNILIQSIQNSAYLALDVPVPIVKRKEYSFIPDGLPHLPFITSAEQMPLALGVSPTGEVVVRDLRDLVHMLVGGATGAGKTIFLYTIILSLLARHPSAAQLEFILCTSKPEDFMFFEGIAHLHGRSIISNAVEAIEEIRKVSAEMLTERSNLLIQDRVRSIEDYNRKREAKDWLRPVVVVVDEFADLGDQVHDDKKAREAFYTNIRQIAQAGRNRGVHLVLCTQRPTTDLIPGSIKSQMNARVALKMNASLDSRIILDQDGAERLLGKGDLIFKNPGTLERLQGFRCDAEEVEHFLVDLK